MREISKISKQNTTLQNISLKKSEKSISKDKINENDVEYDNNKNLKIEKNKKEEIMDYVNEAKKIKKKKIGKLIWNIPMKYINTSS